MERSILLVDGDPVQAQLIANVLLERASHQVFCVEDANAALDFLRRQGNFGRSPRPDLMLLDLQLPDGRGHELLTFVKANPQFRRIPVVVFSPSDEPKDIFQSYACQGNCYVLKPQDLSQLPQLVAQIESFWLEVVTLPRQS